MVPTFLRKNPLLKWLIAFLGLGFFWFYVMLNPWMAFMTSDDAVPFQQSISEWRPQDLYYWGTSRMGMLYEVIWKAALSLFGIRESVVGSMLNVELFCLGHTLIPMLGFAFWLNCFRTWTSRIIFLIFFIPTTNQFADHLLTPAQPYGMIFALNGVFFWMLTRYSSRPKHHVILALLVGAIWIQHELSGMIALGVYSLRSFHEVRNLKSKSALGFFSLLVPILILAYYFKSESHKWFTTGHYALNDSHTFLSGLWYTIRDGAWWFSIRRLTGHFFTIGLVVYFCDLWNSRKAQPFWRNESELAFLGAMSGIVLIHLSEWWVLNNRGVRYFSGVMPLLIWAMLSKAESIPKFNFKKVALLLACVVPIYKTQTMDLWINPVVRAKLNPVVNSTGIFESRLIDCEAESIEKAASPELRSTLLFQLSPTWTSEACRLYRLEKMKLYAQAIEKAGCAAYLDDYWSSHVLAIVTGGRIQSVAATHIRNPKLYGRLEKMRPLCFTPRSDVSFQNYISQLNCKKTPEGFLICRDPQS